MRTKENEYLRQSLSVTAHAKINLTLDVKGKRPDGYHEVELICQSVDFGDIITLTVSQSNEFTVTCVSDSPDIPRDMHNIAAKAAEALALKTGLKCSVAIYIQKRIPHGAGLGGGSSDAAAVLRGMNDICRLDLGIDELSGVGAEIGADVPFCIHGGAAICRGIGTDIEDLMITAGIPVLIIKPPVTISTAWAYTHLDLQTIYARPDTAAAAEALKSGDIPKLGSAMKNVLEMVSVRHYPIIDEIKESMVKNGAVGAMMSGSGSAVFGLFENFKTLSLAYAKLGSLYGKTIATKTISENDALEYIR
jgi:4-diphosphocytidyl-2-C-methyl-D-erythritol kinase